MRSAGASIEPGLDACPFERMFEQALIVLRGADEDGHLIERDAAPRFRKHSPGYLHALAAFAGSGEELQRSIQHARRRRIVGNQEGAKTLEVGRAPLVDPLMRSPGALHGVEGGLIVTC